MKYRNRIFRSLLAGILAVGMIAGTGTAAFADDPEPNKGTEADEATAFITKNLYMDPNVATPAKDFTFEQTKVSLDDETTDEAKAKMPDLTLAADPTIQITASSAGYFSADDVTFHAAPQVAGDTYKAVPVVSADLVHGASGAALAWPHAGEYVYTITEKVPAPADPEITYSEAEYRVTVYVANGATDGDLYVAAVGVVQKKTDAGETTNVKVDAADGKGITGQGSQFAFKNTYTPMSALQIEKKVSGTYADQTEKFSFKTVLTLPTVGKPADIYTAYICNADGTVDNTTAIEFTKGNSYTNSYDLSHGQYLQFGVYDDSATPKFTPNLPVGTAYTVSEDRTDTDYVLDTDTGKTTVQTADGTATAAAVDATVTGANSTTAGEAKINEVSGNKIGDVSNMTDKLSGNKVIATNKYKTVTPTGILLNNLPFIIMIVVAVGGMILYIVSKRKKAVR